MTVFLTSKASVVLDRTESSENDEVNKKIHNETHG